MPLAIRPGGVAALENRGQSQDVVREDRKAHEWEKREDLE